MKKFEKRYSLQVTLRHDDGDIFLYHIKDCDNFCSEPYVVPPFKSRDSALNAFAKMYTNNMCLEDKQKVESIQVEEHMGVFNKNIGSETQGGYKFWYPKEKGGVAMSDDTESAVESVREEGSE